MDLREFLRTGQSFMITNLITTKEKKILMSTKETFVSVALQKKDILLSQNESLICFEGFITAYLDQSIIELDSKLNVYFTHYSLRNFGRGLRIGSKIRIYNAHSLFQNGVLKGFVMCLYSNFQIMQFSEKDSPFIPIITKLAWSHLSFYDFVNGERALKDVQKKFSLSEKKNFQVVSKILKLKKIERNYKTEFIDHQMCNVMSSSFIKTKIQTLKELVEILNNNFKANIQNNIEMKFDQILFMMRPNKKGIEIFDNTMSLYVHLTNYDGSFGELDFNWSIYKERIYKLNQFMVIMGKKLYLQFDVKDIQVMTHDMSQTSIEKYDEEMNITISEIHPIIDDKFILICNNDIKIKIVTSWGLGLYYIRKINHCYRFQNITILNGEILINENTIITHLNKKKDPITLSQSIEIDQKIHSFLATVKNVSYEKEKMKICLINNSSNHEFILYPQNPLLGIIPGATIFFSNINLIRSQNDWKYFKETNETHYDFISYSPNFDFLKNASLVRELTENIKYFKIKGSLIGIDHLILNKM